MAKNAITSIDRSFHIKELNTLLQFFIRQELANLSIEELLELNAILQLCAFDTSSEAFFKVQHYQSNTHMYPIFVEALREEMTIRAYP